MAYIRLNNKKVRELMGKELMRPRDLAAKLGKNRQTINYLLYWGGIKYVDELAKIFKCKRDELLLNNKT